MEYISNFSLKDIIISEDFRKTEPAAWKMQLKADYYESTGELPAGIIINDENVLIDGYTIYLTAAKYGLSYVPVKRGYVELIEASHRAGAKSYLWKVPPRLSGTIHEGDKCIVRTGQGVRRVRVAKVLHEQYPVQIPRLRNVLKLA